MAETLTIRTAASTEVVKIAVQGPQGPKGDKGDPGDVAGLPLSAQGDTLYRGASQNERLAIGTTGQVLKVSAQGLPSWANESGAVTSVNGQTGAVTVAAAQHTHEFFNINVNGVLISGAGNANANGSYLYSGNFGDRGAYHKDKDSLIYWDGSAWMINVNGQDRYSSTQDVSFPYEVTSWSVLPGTGTAPAPSSTQRLDGQGFEEIVGQRINPTLRGDAAGKNVGTGANDVAAGNHTHAAATQSVAGFLSAADKTKLDGLGTAATKDAPATGNASSTQVVLGNDSRLSDARTPSSTLPHAASHASAGSDPLFDQDLNTTDSPTFASVNSAFLQNPNDPANSYLDVANGEWLFEGNLIFSASDPASARTSLGLGDAATADIGTGSTEVAAGDHVHGNLTSDGKLGSTAGLPVVTTTAGAVTTLALGTANQVLRVNSGATGVEFADPAASGVTGAASSASDVLGVSGANITGVDANADRIVYWNNTSNKLAYGTPADAGAAAASHTHAASDITSGTIGTARLASGTANSGTFLRGDQTWAAVSGVTTGSVDNAVLRADGTGGSTSQSSDINIEDATTATQNNVAITNQHSGQTNSALVLTPKGTGGIVFGERPTGSSASGNARGVNATDLCLVRTSAANVASGERSALLGGANNRASGLDSAAIAGNGHSATAYQAVCIGGINSTASGQGAMCLNGPNTATNNEGCIAMGLGSLADRPQIVAFASGRFAANGDAQRINVILRGTTTSNSAVELLTGTNTTSRISIPSGKVMFMNIMIVGVSNGGGTVATFQRQYAIKNISGTTSEIYAPVTIGTDSAASTSITVDANDTNDALRIQCTGLSATTIRWVAHISAVEVAHG